MNNSSLKQKEIISIEIDSIFYFPEASLKDEEKTIHIFWYPDHLLPDKYILDENFDQPLEGKLIFTDGSKKQYQITKRYSVIISPCADVKIFKQDVENELDNIQKFINEKFQLVETAKAQNDCEKLAILFKQIKENTIIPFISLSFNECHEMSKTQRSQFSKNKLRSVIFFKKALNSDPFLRHFFEIYVLNNKCVEEVALKLVLKNKSVKQAIQEANFNILFQKKINNFFQEKIYCRKNFDEILKNFWISYRYWTEAKVRQLEYHGFLEDEEYFCFSEKEMAYVY